LAWFEKRPLFGRRVLVTRPRHQAAELMRRFERLGAIAFSLPMLEVREPADWTAVDHALKNLALYQWLVFTSVNGVHAFIQRLRALGYDLRALGGLQLAAIGPGTTQCLRTYYLEPDLVPSEYRSENLAAALKQRAQGQRVLLARADRGRDILRQELAESASVDQITVYSQVDLLPANQDALDGLRNGTIEFVTVTSSNIARALGDALDQESKANVKSGRVKLVSISPVTSAVIRELGLPVAAEAAEYTTAGVVQTLIGLAQGE